MNCQLAVLSVEDAARSEVLIQAQNLQRKSVVNGGTTETTSPSAVFVT